MLKYAKLLAATSAAVLLLGVAAGAASANRLSLTKESFRLVWLATERLQIEESGSTVRCPLSLDGAFTSRTLSKVSGITIGSVETAIFANTMGCEGGIIEQLSPNLPWRLQYLAFAGRLPNITSLKIQILRMALSITPTLGMTCLLRTTQTFPAQFMINETAEHRLTTVEPIGTTTVPLEPPCTGNARISRLGRITGINDPEIIEVTLIM